MQQHHRWPLPGTEGSFTSLRTHYFPACSGVSSATGNPGELLGSLKEEFPQLQPCPLEHPSGPFRGTGCLAGGRSMLKTPGVPSPFSLA